MISRKMGSKVTHLMIDLETRPSGSEASKAR